MKKILETKIAFLIVFFSITSAFLAGGVIASLGTLYAESYQKVITFVSFIVGQGLMMVPLVLYLKFKKLSIIDSIRFKTLEYRTIRSIILFSLGLIILSDELDRIIQVYIPTPEYIVDLNHLLKPESLFGGFLLFFAVVILAPLGEEIIFRGFLQQILERQWKDSTRAVLFTSLIFSLIHMNPYWFFQIYILGIFLGFLAWKTNSIIAPLILHGLNNFIALLLSLSEPQNNSFYLWKGHVSPWILILACIGIFFSFRKINTLNMHKK
tara:strand:- start:999 stop:1799 length:801 start_codon:yes stop_codon:yes gene_type:complete